MNETFTIKDIKPTALALWAEGKDRKVWAFHAGMGTGKTTLIHALCEELGVRSAISSPTFAIINEYRSPLAGGIYHMDWYRLKGEEEAVNAGVDDSLQSGYFCLVEWPEHAPGLLPDDAFHVYMEVVDENTRRIHTSNGF